MFTKCLFPVSNSFYSLLWKVKAPSETFIVNKQKWIQRSNLEFVRYAARRGTRAAALAKKLAKKVQQSGKASSIPKYLNRNVKVTSESNRRRCTDENWLETQPIDNVWNMKLYRGKPYSFAEAIRLHRSTHIPSILNDPTALIYANIELDLKLKKKDKFLEDLNGIITFPHEFEIPKKNKIVAVCKSPEDQAKASDAGALYVGSTALIKQILSGAITSDDFDYVVCHPDMYKELNVLRGILRKRFPNTQNGFLRLDVDKAVASFIKGIEYNLKRSAVEPDFGWVDVCIGRLHMPVELLEDNLKHALNKIETHKPAGTKDLLFIIRTLLWCEKSREMLKIPHWEYLPNYPENGILLDVDSDDESAEM